MVLRAGSFDIVQNFLRIVWRDNINDPLSHFRLNTVTYGTKPAAYLATRCLKQLGIEFEKKYPLASRAIQKDCYVDNVLSGADSEGEAKELRNQLIEITNSGCFPLRKWCSNSYKVIEDLNDKLIDSSIDLNNSESTISALGLSWKPKLDKFVFNFNFFSVDTLTKRSLISRVSSIFDPLGLLSPVTVLAKNLIQLSWLRTKDWDSNLHPEITNKWKELTQNLNAFKTKEIPRFVGSKPNIEIHIFCDASKIAYAACCYTVSRNYHSKFSLLLCSKTRIAPLKLMTIPRLELSAALLAAKLCKRLSESVFDDTKLHFNLWSDSEIVLCWLKNSARNWKVFVANRVSQIHELLKEIPHTWSYVSSKTNPADVASRGANISQLNNCKLWWNGPDWLVMAQSDWPKGKMNISEVSVEGSIASLSLVSEKNHVYDLVIGCSSLGKLIRIFVQVRRFIDYCRKRSRKLEFVTGHEMSESFKMLIRLHQQFHFKSEIDCLKRQGSISNSSKLIKLAVFVDNENILRVGGRLSKASLPHETKFPIILSNNDQLTKLIIESEHIKYYHAGLQLLRSILASKFWIIKGTSFIKKTIYKCIICARLRKESIIQLMGDLPSQRIVASPPFTNTGLDYAGPFNIKKFKGKCNKIDKCYICLFVCYSTRALHIELVSELSTEAFIAALKRFIARRGRPENIYCDNGRNFVGAMTKQEHFRNFLLKNETKNELLNFTANEFINWHFLPAYAPHMGGLWEVGVKSIKTHLNSLLIDQRITFEEFYTILCEIEMILNSRPLTALSEDPESLEALTPAHFLLNKIPKALPEQNINSVAETFKCRWNFLRYVSQQFWKRWHKEFLVRLQTRNKWNKVRPNLKIGDLVLLRDESCHPLKWPLARVEKLHFGDDKLVRVVDIRIKDKIITRNLNKLAKLPLDIEPIAQSGGV